MDMVSRVPAWLTPVAWIYITASLLSAAYLAYAIARLPRRSMHPATALVWVTSALYLGPAAVVLYHRYRAPGAGRTTTRYAGRSTAQNTGSATDAVRPTALGGLPGGGASAVAHLIGVPLVIASGVTIAGIDLWVMILVIGALAIALLFVYEQVVTPSRGSGSEPSAARARTRAGVPAAVAAVLTVLAFDVGMGGWMLLLHFNAFMPPATEGAFWFLMQIGILLGLVTAYPAVAWLTRRGSRAVAT